LTERWVLTGGAALRGFYTAHRTTRDLDITPRDRATLGPLPDEVAACLKDAGLIAEAHRIHRQRWQIDAGDDAETVVVELVAGWEPSMEEPRVATLGDQQILVDSPHELLVRKLCALFDRAEPRDLDDVHALLRVGGDLPRALVDAGHVFSGLTASTLASTLRALPLPKLGPVVGWPAEKTDTMIRFRDALLARIGASSGE
jgi:Nucleotidyl transferase AbiEii toxin, Type IV TA system